MWSLDYSDEVKLYFLDNGSFAFGLLRQLAELMISSDGLPPDNYRETKNGLIRWETLDHLVFYKRMVDEKRLIIAVIKPI
jgi:hypothetical protein